MACCWNIQSELKFDGPNPWSPCYSKYKIKTECKRSIDMSKEAFEHFGTVFIYCPFCGEEIEEVESDE